MLIFSGCLNFQQEVSLNPDGSGTMKIHYWLQVSDPVKMVTLDQVGLFNSDSIRNQFTSTFSEVSNISVFSDTTDTTSHAIIELTFSNIINLNNMKPFSEAHFVLQDGAAGQKLFSQFIAPIATGFGFDGSAFRVEYIYSFPGEIITHNATKVMKKNLIWSYQLSEIGKGKTISVTYRPFKLKETPYWIYGLSGFVLLIVIIFLFRKKRDF
jgi:hypothetical protein